MRRRLVIAIASVAALAVVLFAVPLALVLQRTYRNEALLRLQRDTVAATREIDISRVTSDPVELPAGDGYAVYDSTGRRVAGTSGPPVADNIVRDALNARAPTSATTNGRLVVAVPLVDNEQVTGAVRAEQDDSVVTNATRNRWWLLIGVGLGVIALGVVAAIALGRRLARPLERLSATARDLGTGAPTTRLGPTGVGEVDDVALALDRAGSRIDELLNRERAFTADASHQLRTPLAALRIELESLELRGAHAPELSAALTQVDRLQRTIETLLALARDTTPSDAPTPIDELLADVKRRWNKTLTAAGQPLRITIGDSPLTTTASPAVLSEVLDVLVENARDHGAGQVTVNARQDSEATIVIEVSDEGDSTHLDPAGVFNRRSPSAQGHGIGLALARSLTQAEGGELVLGTQQPTTFTLTIPAARALEQGAAVA